MKIECPYCQTTYTAERCGLALTGNQKAKATIACGLCSEQFDVVVMPRDVVQPQTWWDRIRGRQAEVVRVGHTVESFKREA